MATPGRRSNPPLEWLLLNEAGRFEFFQAVRLLERLYPQRRPVGREATRSPEIVRFRAHASLTFPASDIHAMVYDDVDAMVEMLVNFMGLMGPNGALPRHYTELIVARARQRDHALRSFLDVFNHRFISLFYRAWEKYRFPIAFERTTRAQQTDGTKSQAGAFGAAQTADLGGLDRFSPHLLDLTGMGTPGLLRSIGVDLRALLFHSGLLARRVRSACALKGLLRGYFGVGVDVIELTGQWLAIPEASITRLGRANSALGRSAVLGSRFWDPQTKFTVSLGPVGYTKFRSFLPSGDAFRPLTQLTRYFAGEELDFDLQVVVQAAEVPECRLGAKADDASQLGWSTWLKTRPFRRDADDAVFDCRRILGQMGSTVLGEGATSGAERSSGEENNHERESQVSDRAS
jgi:type VI secretion system protein ImpH